MKITKTFLNRKGACDAGLNWFLDQEETDLEKISTSLLAENHFAWANWLVTRCMTTKVQKVRYAIFAAERVLSIYETKYPEDKLPRKAIEAAKAYLARPSIKTKNDAAYDANADAAYAAYAAADAAYAAYVAANAAAYAAANAAYVADATYAGRVSDQVKTEIVQYGLKLIKENK